MYENHELNPSFTGYQEWTRADLMKEIRRQWVEDNGLKPKEADEAFMKAESFYLSANPTLDEVAEKPGDLGVIAMAILAQTNETMKLENRIRGHLRKRAEDLVLAAYDKKKHQEQLKKTLAKSLSNLEKAAETLDERLVWNPPTTPEDMRKVADAEEAAQAIKNLLDPLEAAGLRLHMPRIPRKGQVGIVGGEVTLPVVSEILAIAAAGTKPGEREPGRPNPPLVRVKATEWELRG
ncbi:hypothetical protein [Saccharomonospora glauca]|uniref:Uncharacterized protein n=1 Tax=Saccharomonospora glauca K62 TaxID=928724 RepID=I1CZG4_9PSEU|nr:hypothetical protein [Saccharomonospora glauca]EIE98088.1 hypothetical protein SacglDRAFT_01156 [Saccharomonospora glauca K62]